MGRIWIVEGRSELQPSKKKNETERYRLHQKDEPAEMERDCWKHSHGWSPL